MGTSQGSTERTIGQLVADATHDLSTIVRSEIALAKAEITADAKKAGAGAGMFAGAAFVSLLGLIFLPFTTLMYVLVDISTIGEPNLGGWLLIGLGALLDISHWAQIIANRRDGVAIYNQYGPGRTAA